MKMMYLSDANPRRNPEDRQGLFLVRQLKPEHRRILHDITLAGQENPRNG